MEIVNIDNLREELAQDPLLKRWVNFFFDLDEELSTPTNRILNGGGL